MKEQALKALLAVIGTWVGIFFMVFSTSEIQRVQLTPSQMVFLTTKLTIGAIALVSGIVYFIKRRLK